MLMPIANDLFVVNHDHFAFGLHFPGRMIVVRLADAGLALISPVPIDDELAAQLDELGVVRWLCAPNRFHHMYLPAAAARYPDAAIIAPRGLEKKRPDVAFTSLWDDGAPSEWAGLLEFQVYEGAPWLGEALVFHRPSSTLFATDLIMNVHSCRGLLSQLVYRAEGCYRRPGMPRTMRFVTRDRARARASIDTVLSWAPERLIMAHGDIVERGAADVMARSFAWLPGRAALPA